MKIQVEQGDTLYVKIDGITFSVYRDYKGRPVINLYGGNITVLY